MLTTSNVPFVSFVCVFEDFGALQWSVVVVLLVRQGTGRTGHDLSCIAPALTHLLLLLLLPKPAAHVSSSCLGHLGFCLPRSLHSNWLKLLPLAGSAPADPTQQPIPPAAAAAAAAAAAVPQQPTFCAAQAHNPQSTHLSPSICPDPVLLLTIFSFSISHFFG